MLKILYTCFSKHKMAEKHNQTNPSLLPSPEIIPIEVLPNRRPSPSPSNFTSFPLSTLSSILTTPLRWRARRQSIRELRCNSDETHKEYLKLCAQDKQIRESQPPQYEDVLRGSGVSISSEESMRSRGTSITGRPATLLENPSQRTSMSTR